MMPVSAHCEDFLLKHSLTYVCLAVECTNFDKGSD